MLGYVLFALALVLMVACIGSAIIYMADGDHTYIDMDESGEFEEVVLVK